MAFSLEATIIIPVMAVVIAGSVSYGIKAFETTTVHCKKARVSFTDKYLIRSAAKETDAAVLIEGVDLVIDLCGNINDIAELFRKITGATA